MKEFLEKFIAERKAEMAELEKRMKASTDATEVRKIGEDLLKLRDDIAEAEKQIRSLDVKPVAPAAPAAGINPIATYGAAQRTEEPKEGRCSMEYRKAFMEYIRTGKKADVLESRQNSQITSSDLGVLLPITVVQEIIDGVGQAHGTLYNRVRKTAIRGGVRYPIGSFSATFNRIAETGAPSDRQKAGQITGYIDFAYKVGEIRVAQTLVESLMTVPAFEQKLAECIVTAYLKAMDKEILNGGNSTLSPSTYQNECVGILTEAAASPSRIPAGNTIAFTAADAADWKKWQSKLFAKLPVGFRRLNPTFVFTVGTWEGTIKTLADQNNRPVYVETFNPIDGTERALFKGREVDLIEEGVGIANFDDASQGDCFGLLWAAREAYAINDNLEFSLRRYYDEEKNEWVDKAIVINDGKVLDGEAVYILVKG